MNKERTAVFIGHSNCPLSAKAVIPYIEQVILNGVDTFLNGGQGSFDCVCARAVHQLKAKYPKIKIVLVIPYHNFRIPDETLFDYIINSNTSNSESYMGYKTAIPKRNRYMVENSSAAICYVNHISGGAYKTYQLAEKKKLRIINICDEMKKLEYERKMIMQEKLFTVTTELMVLACLCVEPNCAYEIVKYIEAHSDEQVGVSQNSVFTTLYYLRDKGYVEAEHKAVASGKTREVFSILPEGRMYFKQNLEDYQNHISAVNSFLSFVS